MRLIFAYCSKNVGWRELAMLITSSKLPSIVLYCSRVIDLIRSPIRTKSPLVFKYRAIMLLKWLHSIRNSFSAVHSNSRTCGRQKQLILEHFLENSKNIRVRYLQCY
jgi:hypothetical protein